MDCRGFETLGLRGETVLASSSRQFVLLLHVIASAHLIFFGLVVVEAFNMKLRIVMCSAPRSTSRSSRLRTSLTSNHHFPANSAQDEPHSPLSRKRFSAMALRASSLRCSKSSGIESSPDDLPASSAPPSLTQRPTSSITSSARSRRDCGTVRPSALAVLRLITSSNLVGGITGRSAGFSPSRDKGEQSYTDATQPSGLA